LIITTDAIANGLGQLLNFVDESRRKRRSGRLALRLDSAKEGLYEHWWRGALQLGVAETIEEVAAWSDSGAVVLGGFVKPGAEVYTWARSDCRIGDVLIFHPMMLHRGLVNASDRVRMSVDFRFQKRGPRLHKSRRAPPSVGD